MPAAARGHSEMDPSNLKPRVRIIASVQPSADSASNARGAAVVRVELRHQRTGAARPACRQALQIICAARPGISRGNQLQD